MIDNLGIYEPNNIYCGECSQMMVALPDNCIDLTVTSPPYGNLRDYNGYEFDFEPIAKQLYRVTKVGGVVVWVVGDATIDGSETGTSFRQALGFMAVGFKLHDTMIYQRKTKPLTHNRYEQEFEYMFVLSKSQVTTFNAIHIDCTQGGYSSNGYYRHKKENGNSDDYKWYTKQTKPTRIKGNIWEYTVGRLSNLHPAPFPESLARDHIISWSNPGDIILDPMIGSGTTAKMAYQLQRNYLGFDISQEYVELVKKRLSQTQPPLPIEVG